MKLEIGQFARLKSGYSDELGIGKIDFIANCGVATIDFKNKKLGVFTENIIKSSYNIIDLIEVGDYVNGYKVLNVLDFIDNSKMLSLEKIYDSTITNEDIKSIVTKEQFEQMVYKVGDDKK